MGFFKKLKDRVTSPKATVFLKLKKNSFALGEKLEGTLTVTSEEEFDATEIRSEIRCEEKRKTTMRVPETITHSDGRHETRWVTQESWETKKTFSENPQCSGPLHLSAGQKGEFPFSTNIPGGEDFVSYSDMDRIVTWTVKGVIGVKGRPDVTSATTTISVVEAPEIIMIPCEYCRTLFPETEIACPNCGAKRKA